MSFDPAALRQRFPIFSAPTGGAKLRYLDNAATSQMPREVIDAVAAFLDSLPEALG